MNCQFSFGPNRSYFCSTESHYAWSDNIAPPSLLSILEDPQHPQTMQTPYDVAFPMEPGAYMMCWRTSRGENWYEDGCMDPQYARLARFIRTAASTADGHTTRTVFGPNASFFSMSDRGYCWQNLPPALEDDLQTSLRVRRPTSVALGAHGAFVVIYSDGTISFNLQDLYPVVEGLLSDTHSGWQEAARRGGIVYVALNPHMPGEFYLVYGDGSAFWGLPTEWAKDVTTVSREIKPVHALSSVSLGGTAPSAPIATPAPAPAPAHKMNWVEGVTLGLKVVNAVNNLSN
ncbi:hypothetical protein GGX14DRAFT_660277, partial [Mycena pura]